MSTLGLLPAISKLITMPYSLTFLFRDLHRLRRLMWSWWPFRETSQGNISLFLTANYACKKNFMMFSWTGKAKFSELLKKNQAIENHSSCFYCLKHENREWLSKPFLIIFILFFLLKMLHLNEININSCIMSWINPKNP